MKEQHIVVTGSAGFIGFSLCLNLLEKGHKVIGIDNFNDYYLVALKEARAAILRNYPGYEEKRLDLCDSGSLSADLSNYDIPVFCHLAAQAGVRYSLTNPMAYQRSNLAGFLNVLELVRHRDIERLVFASSSSVYGGNTKMPFSESDRVDTPVSLYAATKKANELMAHSYTHLYGFQTVGLRFFTVYGPWGRPDMAMWLFSTAIKAGKPIKVFNYGNMKRDFTYIDDIVDGIMGAMFSDGLDRHEIFNLGNHRSENLMEMISIIESELGIKADKHLLPLQPGDVPESYADIELASRKLGFHPRTTIKEGIPKFIAWLNHHPEFI
ncbi:MAG: NAD-dependent epimerase/dehydratase family protein [Victivallales bacterium]|nr:NAD-dependent epimerase/dehydratase family protein [Victivallales bacterium]